MREGEERVLRYAYVNTGSKMNTMEPSSRQTGGGWADQVGGGGSYFPSESEEDKFLYRV